MPYTVSSNKEISIILTYVTVTWCIKHVDYHKWQEINKYKFNPQMLSDSMHLINLNIWIMKKKLKLISKYWFNCLGVLVSVFYNDLKLA